MNIIDAFINAAAVWFVLKAVEVAPFAIYDLFVLGKQRLPRAEHDSTYRPSPKHPFDRRRGRLEFVVSGAGFLGFSSCQRRVGLFLLSSLAPLAIFALEIFSIFLGNETRRCQTSRDPNVVKAPSLQLFGEGRREVNVIDLEKEVHSNEEFCRPCLRRQWTYSGVEYVAAMCADLTPAIAAGVVSKVSYPEHDRLSIAWVKAIGDTLDLPMVLFTHPFKNSLENSSVMGTVHISSKVFVNGKVTLRKNVTEKVLMDENIIKQVFNDVRALERTSNDTPSRFTELSDTIVFDSTDSDEFRFIRVARNLILALMFQSRRVELNTAAEMSVTNVFRVLPEIDILCEEDFSLPRTVSIVIIVTGVLLRLLLSAVPKSLSSAEYAMLHSEKGDERCTFTELTTGQPDSASL